MDKKALYELLKKKASLTDDEKLVLAKLDAEFNPPADTTEKAATSQPDGMHNVVALVDDLRKQIADMRETAAKSEKDAQLDKAIESLVAKAEADRKEHAAKYPSMTFPTDAGKGDDRFVIQSAIDTPATEAEQKAAHEINDLLLINAPLLAWKNGVSEATARKMIRESAQFKSRYGYAAHKSAVVKALSAGGSTSGAEFVPTGISASAAELIHLESKVASLFENIMMPTNPYNLPFLSTDVRLRLLAENTSDSRTYRTGESPNTGANALTAKFLGAIIPMSDEFDADSVVAAQGFLSGAIFRAFGRGLDQAIISGDTTSPHMDADTTASDDCRKAWIGLRKLATTGADCSTFTAETINGIPALMGAPGAIPSDGAWIAGPKVFRKLLTMKDSNNNLVATMLNMQPAGFTSGAIAVMWGSPLVVSDMLREDLNAAGVDDSTTSTKAVLLYVNTRAFVVGTKKDFELIVERVARAGQIDLIASFRKAFKQRLSASAQVLVAKGYNIAIT